MTLVKLACVFQQHRHMRVGTSLRGKNMAPLRPPRPQYCVSLYTWMDFISLRHALPRPPVLGAVEEGRKEGTPPYAAGGPRPPSRWQSTFDVQIESRRSRARAPDCDGANANGDPSTSAAVAMTEPLLSEGCQSARPPC